MNKITTPEGVVAGWINNNSVETAENIDGRQLKEWLTEGVPGLRARQHGDEIIEERVIILPSAPLFGLALLEHLEEIGWKIDGQGA